LTTVGLPGSPQGLRPEDPTLAELLDQRRLVEGAVDTADNSHAGQLEGGSLRTAYVWGDEFTRDGRHMANTWQGEFPWQNRFEDGYERTVPVGSFPANGYGLCDMAGNVWEWTTDWFQNHDKIESPCCTMSNPRGAERDASYDPRETAIKIPRKVMKRGSHLCAPNYCHRYRPAARMAQPIDTSICHLGFRCVVRPAGRT
jgi:formylglycine-generating enzyme